MSELCDMSCEVCKAGDPVVTDDEALEYLLQIPDWKIIEPDGINRLERLFKFKNFAEALEFTNKVGALAEEHGHHPSITTRWAAVKVVWWTQKIRGLHQTDFIMAAKTDRLFVDNG